MSDNTSVKSYLPWLVATALFMEQLDSTIVNTAIPSIAASLNVTPLSLKLLRDRTGNLGLLPMQGGAASAKVASASRVSSAMVASCKLPLRPFEYAADVGLAPDLR